MIISQWIATMQPHVKKRIWLFSDLQQQDPAKAEAGLSCAVQDIQDTVGRLDYIWYLGDATEGANLQDLNTMTRMHLKYLIPLNVPLRYVLGNHDFDYYRSHITKTGFDVKQAFPFADAVRSTESWRTTDNLDSFYFTEDIGDFLIIFLSDHAHPEGIWHTTHGNLRGDTEAYPHREREYEVLRQLMQNANKPIIILSHYAFAGGARPSALHDRLLPLPETVKVHFHGHAHIGDVTWAGKDAFRKIAGIDNQHIPQINVSSLESQRGSSIRSCILDIYSDLSLGVHFRDHVKKRWTESYILDSRREP